MFGSNFSRSRKDRITSPSISPFLIALIDIFLSDFQSESSVTLPILLSFIALNITVKRENNFPHKRNTGHTQAGGEEFFQESLKNKF